MSHTGTIPCPGEFYKDQENRLYRTEAVAVHGVSGEKLVVCQELFGAYRAVAWPLGEFIQEPDGRMRGPEDQDGPCTGARCRFEKVHMAGEEAKDAGGSAPGMAPETEPAPNPYLLEFFEAMDDEDYDAMLGALGKLSDRMTDKELEDIYLVMDLKRADGDRESQIASIKKHILMLKKFDGVRLR